MVSYRGYGESEGTPSERGIRLDATAAVTYVKDRADKIDTSRIFLFGRSIGGAVAIGTAANRQPGDVKGVIVENSFTSIDDMIDVVFPPLKVFKFLNRNKWNSLSAMERLKAPVLFIRYVCLLRCGCAPAVASQTLTMFSIVCFILDCCVKRSTRRALSTAAYAKALRRRRKVQL